MIPRRVGVKVWLVTGYTDMRKGIPGLSSRAGSVCLNSFGRFAKWISASIMPPPSSVSAH